MAEQLLGTIFIFSDNGSYKKNDVIRTYYDTFTNKILVKKNDSQSFIGDSLTNESPRWYNQAVTGYKRTQNGFRYTYPTQSPFPYHRESREVISPDDPDDGGDAIVDDLEVRTVFVSDATTGTSYDGVVKVLATGTNKPFEYSMFNPTSFPFAAMQESVRFPSLPPGPYTIYARDSLGNVDSTHAEVDISPSSSYGVRWRMDYTDESGEDKRIDILERDYSLSITEVDGSGSPHSFSTRAENQDLTGMGVISSSMSIKLLSNTIDKFRSITVGDEKKYLVKQYRTGSFELEFTGYIRPSTFRDSLAAPPYHVTVDAFDGLADMAKHDFAYGISADDTVDPKKLIKGRISHLEALKVCLDKLKLGNGYRIACNIFASAHNSRSSDTPLEQTFFDSVIYTSQDGTRVEKCDTVVSDILSVYKAFLISWEGYWYIVRQEEMIASTVNYVQFNSELTQTTTGNWSPRIALTSASSGTGFRWSGAQPRTFSKSYKRVILSPNLITDSVSLNKDFTGSNLKIVGGQLIGFNGFTLGLFNDGARSDIYSSRGKYFWDLSIPAKPGKNGNSNTYISTSGTVSYRARDVIRVRSKIHLIKRWSSSTSSEPPPYYVFKWSLKIGNRWVSRDGTIKDRAVLNEEYVESSSILDFEQLVTMDRSPSKPENYVLKVYGLSVTEKTASVTSVVTSDANVGVLMATYKTSSRPIGDRVIISRDSNILFNSILYYYELQSSKDSTSGVNTVRPSDYNSSTNATVWRLITTRRFVHDIEDATVGRYMGNIFENVEIAYLQDGIERDISLTTSRVGNKDNEEILRLPMNQFDLDFDDVLNSASIIKNYLKLSGGAPTSGWRKRSGGNRKSIQEHQLDWLVYIGQKTRVRINGRIKTRDQITPLKVLYDANDGNRIYLLNGISQNKKTNEVSGEFLEISSDDQSGSSFSAFSTGFSQNSMT